MGREESDSEPGTHTSASLCFQDSDRREKPVAVTMASQSNETESAESQRERTGAPQPNQQT